MAREARRDHSIISVNYFFSAKLWNTGLNILHLLSPTPPLVGSISTTDFQFYIMPAPQLSHNVKSNKYTLLSLSYYLINSHSWFTLFILLSPNTLLDKHIFSSSREGWDMYNFFSIVLTFILF